MIPVINDIDRLLQAAPVRLLNPNNASIILTPSAPGFHLTADGEVDIGVITIKVDLIGLEEAVQFSAQGATISNTTDRSVDVTYGGSTAIVTATVISAGETFTSSCIIPVLRDGSLGSTTYTWIRYADSAAGAGISNDPSGKEYIGFAYNRSTAEEGNNPADYKWSLIAGTDGQPGENGADGATLYTWIKYSANADGAAMGDVPSDSTMYIGIAVNKTTAVEGTNPAEYTWSKFRGADGVSVPGSRGAGFYRAVGGAWNDATADAITPGGNVVGDIVTISNGTVSYTKEWSGSAWFFPGAFLTGNLLVERAIYAALIAVDAVRAEHIRALEIKASHMDVDSVTARSIKVTGGGGALNRDPFFTDPASWILNNMFAATGPGGAAPANTYVQGTAAYASAVSEKFPVESGKSYNASVWAWASAGNNRALRIGVVFYDAADNALSTPWSDQFGTNFMSAPVPGGDSTWRMHRDNNLGAKVVGRPVPATAKYCRVLVQINANDAASTSSAMAVTGLRLDEMASTYSIEADSIDSRHINGDTIRALVAYVGDMQLGAGGAIRQGQSGYDLGVGAFFGADANGNPALSLRANSGKYFRVNPANDQFESSGQKIINPDLQLASRIASITSTPGDSFAIYHAAGKTYCGAHTAGISNPVNPSYAWSISSDAVQAQFSLGSSNVAQPTLYVTPTGAVAGDEVQCTITCAISDGGSTVVVSKVIYVTLT